MSNYKERLVQKWSKMKGPMSIKNIEDYGVKENLAQLLENQEKKDFQGRDLFLAESDGATNTAALDGAFTPGDMGGPNSTWGGGDWKFRPVALALQRRTFPDLFANKVVGVQAMSTPVGLAYALRFTYNKDGSGDEAAWDKVPEYSRYSGGTPDGMPNDVAKTSPTEIVGVSALPGGGYADVSIPGTAGVESNGILSSAGDQLQISDSRTECLAGVSTCDEDEWRQLGLRIDQVPIEALTRKLAASFSLEAAQDIKAMHGIDIEREMVNVLQYEITAELDRELLTRLKMTATNEEKGGKIIPALDIANGGTRPEDFGRWNGERYMSIISAIIYQANQIAISTRRGPGNFVIVSPAIATALQAAGHQFVNYDQNVNPGTTMAPIGKLNGTIDVYRDQYATSDYALVGYKGPGVSDSGVIYSPYIMGLQNRAISPDDFSPRVGVMSRYALTDSLLGAGRYYRLIPFVNVASMIPGAN